MRYFKSLNSQLDLVRWLCYSIAQGLLGVSLHSTITQYFCVMPPVTSSDLSILKIPPLLSIYLVIASYYLKA
jgi:hypothetical protein